ncbi:unnamed protein product [Strongylus vulgaris]|uniref:Uncharacterized protein n=1 Tax=Strongylus vulgaris TaxID=40348 RepID=A0A3P7I7T7_STRVU|nr:unnamed protein product [Strongylus vulgaris]
MVYGITVLIHSWLMVVVVRCAQCFRENQSIVVSSLGKLAMTNDWCFRAVDYFADEALTFDVTRNLVESYGISLSNLVLLSYFFTNNWKMCNRVRHRVEGRKNMLIDVPFKLFPILYKIQLSIKYPNG